MTRRWLGDMLDISEEYDSRGIKKTFGKAVRLRNIDSGEDCYEFVSLETRDELIYQGRCPPPSVDVDININVATNIGKLRRNDMPADSDEWDFRGAVGLDKV